jgi:ribonucleoside-diphosphate reductase alpha chain
LGIQYNSEKAFKMAETFMEFFRDSARENSVALARERGVFPNFHGSIYDAPDMPRPRNATTTTIAPTGTLSIIADCSSGIEPLFDIAYKRLIVDSVLTEFNKYFLETARKMGFYSESLISDIMQRGSLRGIKGVPLKVKKLFRTAHEIHYKDHIEMQASFQKYTDNAVSKTINLPVSAKKEDIRYGSKEGTLVRFPDVA